MKKTTIQLTTLAFLLFIGFACGDGKQKEQQKEEKAQKEQEAKKEERRRWAVKKLDESLEDGSGDESAQYVRQPDLLYEKDAEEVEGVFLEVIEKYKQNLKEAKKDWADHPKISRYIDGFGEEAALYHQELQLMKEEGIASDEELKEEYIQYLQNLQSEYEYILIKMTEDK